MDSIRIVAEGENEGSKANARGKLFEQVATTALKNSGYDIEGRKSNVTYAGMEIDIEGKARITGTPLYAECKCYNKEIDCPKFQAFYAKYMTRWFKDDKAQGLFLALPGINGQAMGFYRENCEGNKQITLRLLQEADVLDALMSSGTVVRPETFTHQAVSNGRAAGDRILVCSQEGFFWLQHLIPEGSGIPKAIQFFDARGIPISDAETIERLVGLLPEVQQFEIIKGPSAPVSFAGSMASADEAVVEVRGSSSCFEYQFPAAPEFFVGREEFLETIETLCAQITSRKTSSRGILFEANSGWGKSSLVLAASNTLTRLGHYAVAIDCRTASSPHFILNAAEHILAKFGDFDGLVENQPVIGGIEGAADALLSVGFKLETEGKLLVIFFDQFENIFHLPDVLSRLTRLCLKVADAGTNVVLGFSWKTDLVGHTRDFPYRERDAIIAACRVIHLSPFSENETNALLDSLASELKTKLRKDLKSLLSEFSQGYPWLLKKLCAHVKSQREAGVVQSDMARALLNVDQLFVEDLQGLTPAQDDALRNIAKLAPVGFGDIGEEFSPQIIQSLVDRRLIVKVGSKYDIYWDIFRDYLNTGSLPIEEVYLLRAQVGSIRNALSILQGNPYGVNVRDFKIEAELSDGAYFNLARDLRLLHLAQIKDDTLILSLPHVEDETAMDAQVRDHLKDHLPRNRCIHHVLKILRDEGEIDFQRLSDILKVEFPYISAVEKTWRTYGRILATWLDVSDLAALDRSTLTLLKQEAGAQVRDRSLAFSRRRSALIVPPIHFAPVVEIATRLVSSAQIGQPVDWSGLRRSTIYKALSILEEMKLISRKSEVIFLLPDCESFVRDSSSRINLARKAASRWEVFSVFLSILGDRSAGRLSHKELAKRLLNESDANWKISTAETNAKIMLDWARHLGLATGPYVHSSRGQFSESEIQEELPLFDKNLR